VDRSALGGVGLAVAGIALGLYLDGGKMGQMLQPTAALIVFGGTLGAVIVQILGCRPSSLPAERCFSGAGRPRRKVD
jgi:flagellar motor component MotA